MKITEIALDANSTKCVMTGAVVGYPKPFMVSVTNPAATATVPGKPSDGSVKDCIEAAAEDLVKRKLIPGMRERFSKHGTDN